MTAATICILLAWVVGAIWIFRHVTFKLLKLRIFVLLFFISIFSVALYQFYVWVGKEKNVSSQATMTLPSVNGLQDDIKKYHPLPSASPALNTASNLFDKTIPKKEKPTNQAIQEAITLYERYDSQWEQTIDKTSFSTSIDKKTLRAVFEKGNNNYRLTPIIRNNLGIPLMEPKIIIRMPINVYFKQLTLWNYTKDEDHHVFLGRIYESVASIPLGVNEHLILGFPKEGKYPVEYMIIGIVDGKEITVRGKFYLELTKEK